MIKKTKYITKYFKLTSLLLLGLIAFTGLIGATFLQDAVATHDKDATRNPVGPSEIFYNNGTATLIPMTINDKGYIGIGINNATHRLQVNATMEVVKDGGHSAIYAKSYYDGTISSTLNGGYFVGERARGTMDNPQPVQADDNLALFSGRGYDGDGFDLEGAGMYISASETWNPSGIGSYIAFKTTQNGSIDNYEIMRIANTGNVGIGTATPQAKLDVVGSAVFGQSTTASGTNSAAFGGSTTASGARSIASGYGTTASGDTSHAFGYDSTASGIISVVFGENTQASGRDSAAFGSSTTASGNNSVAFGNSTTASGRDSAAFSVSTTASGIASAAFGYLTTASYYQSTAFGYNTTASNYDSTAFGQSTTASGIDSTAFGSFTTASGYGSTSFGDSTTAQPYVSVVLGKYNEISGTTNSWISTDPLFVIGNGADASNRNNAVTVLKNGNVGIGLSTPTQPLQVAGIIESTSDGFKFPDGTTQTTASTSGSSLWTQSGSDIYYNTGKVGIGDSTPDKTLDVAGSIVLGVTTVDGTLSIVDSSGNADRVIMRQLSTNNIYFGDIDDNDGDVIIRAGGWDTLVVADGNGASGKVGIGTSSPSQKLDVNGDAIANSWLTHSSQKWKKDIIPLDNTLDKITQIQGVTYQWRADEFPEMSFDDTTTQIGFIAEELEMIYPELVYTTENGDKSIDYSKLTPILIEAIKEQQNSIEEQQDMINTQQDILEQLKTVICPDNPELSACQ